MNVLDHLQAISASPIFRSFSIMFAVISILLGVAVLIFLLQEYRKGFDRQKEGTNSDGGVLVISTLADVFIINAAYVVVELLRGSGNFLGAGALNSLAGSYLLVVRPFLEVVLLSLIAFVVFRRLTILRNWLTANSQK